MTTMKRGTKKPQTTTDPKVARRWMAEERQALLRELQRRRRHKPEVSPDEASKKEGDKT